MHTEQNVPHNHSKIAKFSKIAPLGSPHITRKLGHPFTHLKDIHDFLYHGRTDRHTNSIQNKSPLYPIWVQAKFFSALFFLPLTKWHELALRARSRHFVRINFKVEPRLNEFFSVQQCATDNLVT